MTRLLMLAIPLLACTAALAEEGESFRAISDAATAKECSACHMAYQPGMMPARSWEALMADLPNHFGENAALPEALAKGITTYLTGNAAPAGSAVLRGVAADQTPLRITALPWWRGAHDGEVSLSDYANPKVGSKANCAACHANAALGVYEGD